MKLKRLGKIVFVLLAVLTTIVAAAQSDYSNVDIDKLSDAQIKQMMERIGDMGYSDAELEKAAAARGLSTVQISKLRERVNNLRSQNNTQSAQSGVGREMSFAQQNTLDTLDKAKSTKTGSRIFGSAFFSGGGQTFEPNLRLATPANYVIGPDDLLLLDLTGDNEASYKLLVSPEGYISLEYVGRIAVGGLTIEQAKSKIRATMSGTYPALQSGRTQIALTLGNIRSIKVAVNGEVTKPGTYTLPSVASVINALYASGGPGANGSFRNIQVIRGNQVVATLDVYDFLIEGVQTGNIRLQDQDVIHVPVYQTRVDVLGEVKRPAIYELRPEENLIDVLRYAGGFSEMAYKSRIRVFQNTATERKVLSKSISEFTSYKPKNGDQVFVDPILDRFENKVQVLGAVFRPGTYELTPGLSLAGLIKQADGLREDAFMPRGYIIRLNPDNTTSTVSFDVSKVVTGGAGDITLKREDIVQVSSIFDLRDEYKVSIAGEIRIPGAFDYSTNMRVEDLIQMAGGFREGADPMNIEVSRRVKGTDLTQQSAMVAYTFPVKINGDLSLSDSGFVLQPFDMVTVRPVAGYSLQKQVQIIGEVLRPGYYTIRAKNERISDLVNRAGGLTAFAFGEGASLKRPGSPANINKTLDAEEEDIRALNLKRMKRDSTFSDTMSVVAHHSDLVGIKLDEILKNPRSRFDLILEEGDIIRVPSLLQTVKVTGEVLRPINVVYVPGRSLRYYVQSAGGFTKRALKRGSFISYANGSVSGTRKALLFNDFPAVKPGSEITVPQKPERKGVSFEGWVGLGSALASLAAVLVAIIRK
ncbi:MAG: SLBB domain-containing protein [Niabella sp.]